MHFVRNQDATSGAQSHDSGRDIHAIAVDALLIERDLALVDADTERQVFAEVSLDLDASGHSSHRTWEGAEAPVAEVLNEFSAVGSDRSFHRLTVTEPNASGGLFVFLHDGRIPDDIREHHGCEAATFFLGHEATGSDIDALRDQTALNIREWAGRRKQESRDFL